MKKINLIQLVVIAIILVSCGGHTQEAEVHEIPAGLKAIESLSSKDVQDSWELIDVNGANFEMYKGTVLKFDEDVIYYTQNTNQKMGTFFIKSGDLHYTYQGLNEVTSKISIVEGKLQIVNGADQTFIYKKL